MPRTPSSSRIRRLNRAIDEKVRGVWVAEHDDTGHWYRHVKSGDLVPSVTTMNVIKEGDRLLDWAAKCAVEWLIEDPVRMAMVLDPVTRPKYMQAAIRSHADIRDEAGQTGTLAHNLIERWLNAWIATGNRPGRITEMANYDELADHRAIAAARSCEAMFDRHDVVPVATELLVGSRRMGSAGTLDLLVWNNRENWLELWDHKTSNSVHDSYARQVATYAKMFSEMTRGAYPIRRIRVNRLDKSTDRFRSYVVPYPKEALEAQIANNACYRWKNDGKPKLLEDKHVVTYE